MFSRLFLLGIASIFAFASASAIEPDVTVVPQTHVSRWLQERDAVDPDLGKKYIETRSYGALGNAVFWNQCPYDIWIWSVDEHYTSNPIPIKSRGSYTEPFRTPCDKCGVSFKVSKSDQLVAMHHTQFEYAIKNNVMYYDISYVDCMANNSTANCPGHELGHAIDSQESACGRLKCVGGSYCPTQAYYVDKPLIKLGIKEPVLGCGDKGCGMDINFRMCSDQAPGTGGTQPTYEAQPTYVAQPTYGAHSRHRGPPKRSIAGRILLDNTA